MSLYISSKNYALSTHSQEKDILSKKCLLKTHYTQEKIKRKWDEQREEDNWKSTFDLAEFIGRLYHLKAPKNTRQYWVYYFLFITTLITFVNAYEGEEIEQSKKGSSAIRIHSLRSLFIREQERLPIIPMQHKFEETEISVRETVFRKNPYLRTLYITSQGVVKSIRKEAPEDFEDPSVNREKFINYHTIKTFNEEALTYDLIEEISSFRYPGDFVNIDRLEQADLISELKKIRDYLISFHYFFIKAQVAQLARGGCCAGHTSLIATKLFRENVDFELVHLAHKNTEIANHLFLVLARDRNTPLTGIDSLDSGLVIDYCNSQNSLEKSRQNPFPEVFTAVEIKQFREKHEIYFDNWTWRSKFFSARVPNSLKGKYFSKSIEMQNLFDFAERKVKELVDSGVRLLEIKV